MSLWSRWLRRVRSDGNKLPAMKMGRKVSRTPLTLEPLEDRILLSTAPVLPAVPKPPAISTPALSPSSDSGVRGDDLTNVTKPTILGTTAAGSVVHLFVNGKADGMTTATSTGAWSITVASPLSDGRYTVTATATAGGKTSSPSAALVLTIDTRAPAISTPVLSPSSDSGTRGDNLTRVSKPTITGTAESKSLVHLFVDGKAAGTATASSTGSWSITLSSPLSNGQHKITATATDAAGNTSPVSAALVLTIDTTAPSVSTPVLSRSSDSGLAGDNLINLSKPTITGTAQAGSVVSLFVDGKAAGTVTTSSTGSWSLTLSTPLSTGQHKLTATATDTAGNTSSLTSPLVLTVLTSSSGMTVQQAAAYLSNLSFGGSDIAAVLKSTYNSTAANTASILYGLGENANQIAQALSSGIGASPLVIAQALLAVGFGPTRTAYSIAQVLSNASQSPLAIVQALRAIGGFQSSDVATALAPMLFKANTKPAAFGPAFLALGGFQPSDVAAALANFSIAGVFGGFAPNDALVSFCEDSQLFAETLTSIGYTPADIATALLVDAGFQPSVTATGIVQDLTNAGWTPTAIAQTLNGISGLTSGDIACGIAQALYSAGQSPAAIVATLNTIMYDEGQTSGPSSSNDIALAIAQVLSNAGQSPAAIGQTLESLSGEIINGLQPAEIADALAQILSNAGQAPLAIAQTLQGISGLQPSAIAAGITQLLTNAGEIPAAIVPTLQEINGLQTSDITSGIAQGLYYAGQSPAAIAQALSNIGQSPTAIAQTMENISGLPSWVITAGIAQVLSNTGETPAAIAQTLEGISGLQPSDIAAGIAEVLYENAGQTPAAIIQTLQGISGLQPRAIATGMAELLYNQGQDPTHIAEVLEGISGLQPSDIVFSIAQVLYNQGQTPAAIALALCSTDVLQAMLQGSAIATGIAEVLYNAGQSPTAIAQALNQSTVLAPIDIAGSIVQVMDDAGQTPASIVQVLYNSGQSPANIVQALEGVSGLQATVIAVDVAQVLYNAGETPAAIAQTFADISSLQPSIIISSIAEILLNAGQSPAAIIQELDGICGLQSPYSQPIVKNIVSLATDGKNIYWLSSPKIGGWLEMATPGSNGPKVIDTNVSRFAANANSGDIVALKDGNLWLVNSTNPADPVALTSTGNVSSFLLQDTGAIVALEGSTLLPIIPGASGTPGIPVVEAPIASNVSSFELDGTGDALALSDGNLLFFNSSSVVPSVLNPFVTSFEIAENGDAVCYLTAQNDLFMYNIQSGNSIRIGQNVQSFAVAAKGDVVFLQSNGYLFDGHATPVGSPPVGGAGYVLGSNYETTQIGQNVSKYLVDGAGNIIFLDSSTNTLSGFTPGAPVTITLMVPPIVDAAALSQPLNNVSSFGMDASGGIVALNGTNLVWFQPASFKADVSVPDVSSFLVDLAGSVVAFEPTSSNAGTVVRFGPGGATAEASWQNVSNMAEDNLGCVWLLIGNTLSHFAPGATTPMYSVSGIQAFVEDGAGSIVALNEENLLVRYAPGSNNPQNLNLPTGPIKEFAVDGSGYVVALDTNDNLLRFAPGQDSAQPLDPDYPVIQFAVDGRGEIVALESSGTLVRFSGMSLRRSPPRTPMNVDPNNWANVSGNNFTVLAFTVNSSGYVIAITQQMSTNGPVNSLVSFAPGQTQPVDIVRHITKFGQLANGSMLVMQQGNTFYEVSWNSGNQTWNLQQYTNIQDFTINPDNLSYTLTPVNSSPWKVVEEIGEVVVAAAVVIFAPELGPEISEWILDTGISSVDLVADAIGEGFVTAMGDTLIQGYNSLAFGTAFDWKDVLFGGVFAGLGDLGGLGDLVGSEPATFIEDVSASMTSQTLDGNLTSSAVVQDIFTNLTVGVVNGVFGFDILNDSDYFLQQAGANGQDSLPITQGGIQFLSAAASNQSISAFVAENTASLLDQTLANNLGNTQFGNSLGSLLTDVASGKLSNADLQSVLPMLEQSVASGSTSINLNNLATALNGVGDLSLNKLASVLNDVSNGNLSQVAGALHSLPGITLNNIAGALDSATDGNLDQVAGALDSVTNGNLSQVTSALQSLPGVTPDQVASAINSVSNGNLS